MPSNFDEFRRSTLATLDEIAATEKALKDKGIDVTDEGEWMQLCDFVNRIERRWAQKLSEQQPKPTTEAAE